ncbi:MAG: metallopeptidase family protein [Phycisphaeraceae bacterium]|nr:metallopeptidase family protein [Phycisphaeraceae bacterium]
MTMLPQALRDIFDEILEAQIEVLPPDAAEVVALSGVVAEDEPSEDVLASLGMTRAEGQDLCGIHFGVPETERSVEDTGELPSQIMLFRGPIIRLAAYRIVDGREVNRDELTEQIHVTLLHEIGHQFGLDEDDLTELGYD